MGQCSLERLRRLLSVWKPSIRSKPAGERMAVMRIGILTTFLKLDPISDSGIGLLYRALADALVEQGHAVHVVHPTTQPAVAAKAHRELAPKWTCDIVPAALPRVVRRMAASGSWQRQALFERFWAAAATSRALARACAAKDLEIIETHTFAAPALFFLCRRRRPPVVSRVATTTSQMLRSSGEYSRAIRLLAWAEIRATRTSDALLTHSEAHRDQICSLEGYDPRRFGIVPLGIADPGFVAGGPAGPALEFFFVGRFTSRKGVDILLSAIPKVAAACPEATFVLAGDQDGGQEWRAFCASHSDLVPRRVSAPGRIPEGELDRLYRRCSVFVAPSRYESFGLIYVEAMARGRPVVGCRTGGVPEVVRDGVTGLLAAPGDPDSLAAAMIRLGTDPLLRDRFSAAARSDFLERFSAARFARSSAAFYSTVKSHP